jgi:hypothetical protein
MNTKIRTLFTIGEQLVIIKGRKFLHKRTMNQNKYLLLRRQTFKQFALFNVSTQAVIINIADMKNKIIMVRKN